jgi:hypothetical protein
LGIRLDILSKGKDERKRSHFVKLHFFEAPVILLRENFYGDKILSIIQKTKNARNTKTDFLSKMERNIRKQKNVNSFIK